MPVARPIAQLGDVAVDIPHLAFATAMAGWIAWYCWDAWHAEFAVANLILILPVSLLAILLYLAVAAGCFHRIPSPQEEPVSQREPLARGTAVKIAVSMALLAAFVIAGPWVGFDIASFVYIFAMMVYLGERRIAVLLLVPLMFSAIVIYCFSNLLSTPLPVLFLWGQNS